MKKQLKIYVLNSLVDVNLQGFFNAFNTEFYNEYERKRTPNLTKAVSEYLQGLPNIIDLPFNYYDIRQLILSFDSQATERTLNRYENYFFDIAADILITEFKKL